MPEGTPGSTGDGSRGVKFETFCEHSLLGRKRYKSGDIPEVVLE